MTQEQGPKETQKRHFPLDYARMLGWMVSVYNENKSGNTIKQLADDLNLDTEKVEGGLTKLEEIGKCHRTKAVTLAAQAAYKYDELPGAERIRNLPTPQLDKKEQLLRNEFSAGSSDSEIREKLEINLEEFRKIRNKLFRKYPTTNRFFIAVHDYAQKLKNKNQ